MCVVHITMHTIHIYLNKMLPDCVLWNKSYCPQFKWAHEYVWMNELCLCVVMLLFLLPFFWLKFSFFYGKYISSVFFSFFLFIFFCLLVLYRKSTLRRISTTKVHIAQYRFTISRARCVHDEMRVRYQIDSSCACIFGYSSSNSNAKRARFQSSNITTEKYLCTSRVCIDSLWKVGLIGSCCRRFSTSIYLDEEEAVDRAASSSSSRKKKSIYGVCTRASDARSVCMWRYVFLSLCTCVVYTEQLEDKRHCANKLDKLSLVGFVRFGCHNVERISSGG